mmetsp:Transcript_15526/g.23165  ORF Transcript_15526/g.23165 Transcript_15526/m.23165 type:complete len:94 (+) Transcript_15526:132-413(+)
MAEQFSEAGEKPLNDWLFIPTRAEVSNVPSSVLKSKRYIPKMLKDMGIVITNNCAESSNGHNFIDLFKKIDKHKSARDVFKHRFGLNENQLVK